MRFLNKIKDFLWTIGYPIIQVIEIFILECINFYLKNILKVKGSPQDLKNKILILVPDLPGNLGDGAMLNSLLSNINYDEEKIIICTIGKPDIKLDYCKACKTIFIDNGINIFLFLKTINNFIKESRSCERFILIGADMLDGYYSQNSSLKRILLTSIANRIAGKASIISFSFNSTAPKKIIKQLKNAGAELFVRDKVSYLNLKKNNTPKLNLCMDISFLLKPEKTNNTELIKKEIDYARSKKNIIIGINPNNHLLQKGNDINLLINSYSELIAELFKKNKKNYFVLFPSEYRGCYNDVHICKNIYNELAEDAKKNCAIIENKLKASEIKEIISYLDFVFTVRIHVCVACLSLGLPVLALEYQEKFKGLFDFFDIGDCLFKKELLYKTNSLADFIEAKLNARENIKNKIIKKIREAIQLSRNNLK